MSLQKPVILKKVPVVLLQPNAQKRRIPVPDIIKYNKKYSVPLYREEVIYESNGENILTGEYRSITIINRLNILTDSSRTVAKCTTLNNELVEKTSDSITRVLGQEAYNTILYTLCSVINHEYRIRGILALLTVDTTGTPDTCTNELKSLKVCDKCCQTNEVGIEPKKSKAQKRMRRVLAPYVVHTPLPKQNLRKIVIDPADFMQVDALLSKNKMTCEIIAGPHEAQVPRSDTGSLNLQKPESVDNLENQESTLDINKDLPDLGYFQNENSNDSLRTIGTFKTISELLVNPLMLVSDVDKHIKEKQIISPNYPVVLTDGTVVRIPYKPEDKFHIAIQDNLQYLNDGDRRKLYLHQMQIDFKYCLTAMDDDGNLPIHVAVINDDIELLRRQCIILKIRKKSVDITAANGLTALRLSLSVDGARAASALLCAGADPVRGDEQHRTSAHHAAERHTDHLHVVLNHIKRNARQIISEHAVVLQTRGWEQKTDDQLSAALLRHVCCCLYDKPGYTPLMLASKLGHYENIRLILEEVPEAVNVQMPTCGHTALYLAVSAACAVAAERFNKSKVDDHYRKTIEILLERGADPFLQDHNGSNVNALLTEFSCSELSMMVANKITSTKYFNELEPTRNFDKFILVRDCSGDVTIREINRKKTKKRATPTIVSNVLINSSAHYVGDCNVMGQEQVGQEVKRTSGDDRNDAKRTKK